MFSVWSRLRGPNPWVADPGPALLAQRRSHKMRRLKAAWSPFPGIAKRLFLFFPAPVAGRDLAFLTFRQSRKSARFRPAIAWFTCYAMPGRQSTAEGRYNSVLLSNMEGAHEARELKERKCQTT